MINGRQKNNLYELKICFIKLVEALAGVLIQLKNASQDIIFMEWFEWNLEKKKENRI